jgi:hypothetical protein
MNIKIKNLQCHCEGEARSTLLFDKKIDLLRGDCFVATNAPRNDMNVRGVLL